MVPIFDTSWPPGSNYYDNYGGGSAYDPSEDKPAVGGEPVDCPDDASKSSSVIAAQNPDGSGFYYAPPNYDLELLDGMAGGLRTANITAGRVVALYQFAHWSLAHD